MGATISTQTWKSCSIKPAISCADSVVTNHVQEISDQAMKLGWHTDYNPPAGINFSIPKIAEKEVFDSTCREFYPQKFENGEKNSPWLITAMLYAAAQNFDHLHWGMGTAFQKNNNEIQSIAAKHARLVVFEGDALHTMQVSAIPSETETWRISYVWKLLVRPNNPENSPSLKDKFIDFIKAQIKGEANSSLSKSTCEDSKLSN